MLRWINYKLSCYYQKKDEKELKKLIKIHIVKFKKKWPNVPIKVWRSNEWFISIGSWEIYKTEEYTKFYSEIYDEYWNKGFTRVIWGCTSSVVEDDLNLLN
jgi:hypothetical protein